MSSFLTGYGGGFNNGQSQMVLNSLRSADFAFANLMLSAQVIVSGGAGTLLPDSCDSNGWPTSFPSGVTQVSYVVQPPSGVHRPGNYSLTWTGTGVASFVTSSGTVTVVSGSGTPSGGVGNLVFFFTNTSIGEGGNDVNVGFNGPAQNVVLCHVNDSAAIAANPNAFHPQFISVLSSLNPSILRFFYWINFNGPVGLWQYRTPTTYSVYANQPKFLSCYGGKSTASGSDLSVSTPSGGFSLTDKARLEFYLNAAPPSNGGNGFTATTNGTTSISVTSHGLSVNNQIYWQNSAPTNFTATQAQPGGSQFAGTVTSYYVVSVLDANTFTLSATKGGSAITAGNSGTFTLCPYLTISVGGGAATPIWNANTVPYPQAFLAYPTSAAYRFLIYDAQLGVFIDFGTGDGVNSVPPEICLSLCKTLGTHPWFSLPFMTCDFPSDWPTQLATLIKNTYQNGVTPWMVPRFEPANEVWNNISASTGYATTKGLWYGYTGNPGASDAWVGRVSSICGQLLANVFGGGNLGTKYHWITGLPTQQQGARTSDRVASSQFVTGGNAHDTLPATYHRYAAAGLGGSSPQNWVSHIGLANYFSPLERYTLQELIDGFNYTVTNAGNATAQAALALGYINTLFNPRTTVTVTSGSPNITWTSHGLVNDNQVAFLTTSPPTGYSAAINYFVVVVDANTIKLSTTAGGGSIITPTANGSPILAQLGAFNLANNFWVVNYWLNQVSTYGVTKCCFYEGGYSPDYITGNLNNWSSPITGATNAASCILTLGTPTTNNDALPSLPGNPATVGMPVVVYGVGGMTQLNNPGSQSSPSYDTCTFTSSTASISATNTFVVGQVAVFQNPVGVVPPNNISIDIPYYVLSTGLSSAAFQISTTASGPAIVPNASGTGYCIEAYAITNVSSASVTIGISSTGFGTYTSGGTMCYVSSRSYSNNLRGGGKLHPTLQTYLTDNYNDIVNAGGNNPSCFQFTSNPPPPGLDVWSILDGGYQPLGTSPQALAIKAYNGH